MKQTGEPNQYSDNHERMNCYFLVVHVFWFLTCQLALYYEKSSLVSDLAVMVRSSL